MEIPKLPDNEEERLKALHDLKIVNTPIEKGFERITRLAKKIFDVPIVNITFIDKDTQFIKSSQGLEKLGTTPRDIAFCSHTILGEDVLVVNDAVEDKRFNDNPFVTEDPKIRFYAGCPVREKNNQKVGTICLIDQRPRTFTEAQIECFKDLASLVENELQSYSLASQNQSLNDKIDEIRKASSVDTLTRVWNRGAITQIVEKIYSLSFQNKEKFLVGMVDIDHFKLINDSYGHQVGDKVLCEVAKMLVDALRKNDAIGRWGGEEFLLIMQSGAHTELYQVLSRIKSSIEKTPIIYKKEQIFCTLTIGATVFDPNDPKPLEDLIGKADKNLYRGKNTGRNKVVLE